MLLLTKFRLTIATLLVGRAGFAANVTIVGGTVAVPDGPSLLSNVAYKA